MIKGRFLTTKKLETHPTHDRKFRTSEKAERFSGHQSKVIISFNRVYSTEHLEFLMKIMNRNN